jgi:hypothetical protein
MQWIFEIFWKTQLGLQVKLHQWMTESIILDFNFLLTLIYTEFIQNLGLWKVSLFGITVYHL